MDSLERVKIKNYLFVTKTRLAKHVRAHLPIGACFERAFSEVEFIDGLHRMKLRHCPFSISPLDFLSKI
jgi:hypothetical protein